MGSMSSGEHTPLCSSKVRDSNNKPCTSARDAHGGSQLPPEQAQAIVRPAPHNPLHQPNALRTWRDDVVGRGKHVRRVSLLPPSAPRESAVPTASLSTGPPPCR